MGSLVAELAEKLSSATNNFDIDDGTIYVNTSADTVAIGGTSPDGKFSIHQSDSADILNLYDGTTAVFTVLDGGNVGIGTTTPAKLLEVSGTESTLRLTDTDTAVSDGEYISGIEFYQNDSAGAGIGASIKAHGQGSTGLTQLRFATGATTNAETVAMVINKDGNIGIGTTAPDEKLHLHGTEAVIKLEDSAATGEGYIDFDGSSLQLNTHRNPNTGANSNNKAPVSIRLTGGDADGSIAFSTKASNSGAATTRMQIDKDGKVGIGTTAPAFFTQFVGAGTLGSGTIGGVLQLQDTAAYNATQYSGISFAGKYHSNGSVADFCSILGIKENSTDNNFAGMLTFHTRENGGNGTERMRITSDGKVGIGTTAPASQLEVVNTSYTSSVTGGKLRHGVTFQIEESAQNPSQVVAYSEIDKAVQFGVQRNKTSGTSNDAWVMGMAEDSRDFRIAKDTLGTALNVNTGGTLSVGDQTVNPSNNASRGVSLAASGLIHASRAGAVAYIDRSSGTGDIVVFTAAETTIGSISKASSGDRMIIGQGSARLFFDDGGTKAIWPADGSYGVDNSLDLGDGSYRWDDVYATNGTIQTSDRNEKQDIEELSEAEQRVAVVAKGLLRKFRWKSSVSEKGDDARIHFGIIAQDLKSAFEAEGLDAGRYAMFIHSEWWEKQTEVPAVEAVDAVLDDEGNVIEEAVEAKEAYTRTDTYDTEEEAPEGAVERTRLGVRYSELLAFIIAAI